MRKLRELQKGAMYHVTSKINGGENKLKPKEVKLLFLKTVKKAKKKYKFLIQNFVVMNNHIHFIIQPLKNECLSRIMQWILSNSARRFNKMYKKEGHLWRARFWSKIVRDFKQLFDTFKYIAENPVKAELVKDAKDYRFGGLYFILKGIFDIVEKPKYNYEY